MALQRWRDARQPVPKARSLAFFVSSIRDPYNLQHCATCLDGAFRQCSDVEEWQLAHPSQRDKSKPIEHNPELWNAIIKFLLVKRSKKQMERLLTRLSECTCRMDQQTGDVGRYHQRGLQRFRHRPLQGRYYNDFEEDPEAPRFIKPWRAFLFNLTISLSIAIECGSPRAFARGASTSWPINSTELLPYGADVLVESILQWYQFTSDPVLIRLMRCVLDLSRELVIPSMVKYKFTAKVIETTREFLDRIVVEQSGIPKPMGYLRYKFPWQVSDVVRYFGSCSVVVFHEDYKEALFRDCETKAMQLCSLIIYASHGLQDSEGRPAADVTGLCDLGQHLFHMFLMDRPSQPAYPVHPKIKEFDSTQTNPKIKEFDSMQTKLAPKPLLTPLQELVLNTLRNYHLDMRCSAKGCMNSLQTAGKDFQRCGKCNITTYCGRDCQRKAWTDEEHPHKRICPIIANLVEKAGGTPLFAACARITTTKDLNTITDILEKMDINWSHADLDDNDLNLVLNWLLSVQVARGCTGLNHRELSPGFSDYDATIAALSSAEGAPEPVYLDRRDLSSLTESSPSTITNSE